MPTVNQEILVWARESAGLTPEAAVKRLGIGSARGVSAIDRLLALESGHVAPTRSMLLKMAQQYRRPLVTFYLSSPPQRGDRGEDFRNVPDRQTNSDVLVDALVRDVRARQSMVREILLEDEESRPLPFIGSMTMAQGSAEVLTAIQKTVGLDLKEFRSKPSPETAFASLRARAEAAGIFVLLIGNLGSHHTAIDVEAFRGFALADSIAPFVVINDQDAHSAWSFTLLHELAHLWLGSTGVSGKFSDAKIETFCNDVASAFLLPQDELRLLSVNVDTDQDTAANEISAFARQRNLSSSMVTYSLWRGGMITDQMWRSLSGFFLAAWRNARNAQREKKKETNGPDYYVVRRHRLGLALLHLVTRSINEGSLTPTKAGQVLGVKPRSVAPLLNGTELTGGRAA